MNSLPLSGPFVLSFCPLVFAVASYVLIVNIDSLFWPPCSASSSVHRYAPYSYDHDLSSPPHAHSTVRCGPFIFFLPIRALLMSLQAFEETMALYDYQSAYAKCSDQGWDLLNLKAGIIVKANETTCQRVTKGRWYHC